MKRIVPFLVAIGLIILGFRITQQDDGHDPVDIASLARQQAQRETQVELKTLTEKKDLALLAEKGLGQALPGYLVTEVHASGKFWVVANPKIEMGVEIPFAPGQLPRPKIDSGSLENPEGFLGAAACQSCHADKYETFVETAHHRTSRIASVKEISGPLAQGRNVMQTSHPEVNFEMLQRGNVGYQRVSFFDWQFEVPMQLIMGSSKMAETYLFWHGDKLFQANCSYLEGPDAWINSPGYLDGDAAYARPILSGCLDCHTTYAELEQEPNRYSPKSMILGISCERCHGPGKDHVDFHLAHPLEKQSKHMIVPSNLSREREMDVCGQCHTGDKAPKSPEAFQFRPGDRLSDHYDPLEGHDESANSVHTSNQIARLALSRCFQESEMACVQCHDPHKNERGMTAIFSERCLKCHQEEHCGMQETLGPKLKDNCVDCHMPKRATENLRVETMAGQVFPPLRDHLIRVDLEATKAYLDQRNEDSN